jgi:hypothetical protein
MTMAKKTPKQLDDEIDAYLRYEKIGPREVRPAPKYDAKKGMWRGGDRRTLYVFASPSGSWWRIAPGIGDSKGGINHGPDTIVRVATEAEAKEKWQNPLHSGWNVRP